MRRRVYKEMTTSAWTLAALLAFFELVQHATASTSILTKRTLLAFQKSWSTVDASGASVPSERALGWHRDSDPCHDLWQGVECVCGDSVAADCQTYEVIALNLSAEAVGRQLHGLVPDIFDQLPQLQHLDLADHQLQGRLPSTILQHTALQTVNLRNNLFAGPVQGPLSEQNSLFALDIGFNMLSGDIGSGFCDISNFVVSGNSLLCGLLPHCMRYMSFTAAAGTGLTGVIRPCSMPVASCMAPPNVRASNSAADFADFGATLCKAAIDKEVFGRVPVNISFSTMTNVDVLVVEITDSGLHSHRAWFWAQDYMLQALLDPQVMPEHAELFAYWLLS